MYVSGHVGDFNKNVILKEKIPIQIFFLEVNFMRKYL